MKLRIQIPNSRTGLYYSNPLSYCLQDRITGARHKSSTPRAQLKEKQGKNSFALTFTSRDTTITTIFLLIYFNPSSSALPFSRCRRPHFSHVDMSRNGSAGEPQRIAYPPFVTPRALLLPIMREPFIKNRAFATVA